MARDDHYAVLGLTPGVGVAEIRRAYRLLALRHHPDRAGPDATATFQRIAEAYRVLSDAGLRSSYDAERPRPAAPVYPVARATETLILRLCGTLDALVARRIVYVHAGGVLDLFVNRDEARAGGVSAIQLPLTVPCPTCGGIASRDFWCRRCEFVGSVVELVTLCVPIPARAPDGLAFNIELDRLGDLPPMTVRLRVG